MSLLDVLLTSNSKLRCSGINDQRYPSHHTKQCTNELKTFIALQPLPYGIWKSIVWIFWTIDLHVRRNATAPLQQTHAQTCIFHKGFPSLYPLYNRQLFPLQLSSQDDQSQGDSVFVMRLIIPPLSGVTTVCMLIASFQDHFSTSFTSTKNSLRGRFNILVWLDVKRRPNTATMPHLDAIISN